MITVDENIEEYFCSKCGKFYNTLGTCNKCNEELTISDPYKVKRKCNKCGEITEATPSYFVDHHTCTICKEGTLEVIKIHRDTHHFIFDGQWDGRPMGKRIRERNEQLKKKNEGYSYENPQSLGDRTRTMYNERKKK